MRRALAIVLALALAGVLALAIGEGAVRAAGLAPGVAPIELSNDRSAMFETSLNPILRYVPQPGGLEINEHGFRDRSYPVAKPDGTYRIVVIGDSVGFGLCVDLEDSFPKQLERALAERPWSRPEHVEVLNFAVSGYDTQQEVEFLKLRGLAFDPDLVLVAFCLNDFGRSSWELSNFREHDDWERWEEHRALVQGRLLQHSHLARLALVRMPALRERFAPPDAIRLDPKRDRVALGFSELRTLAESHGFEVLVVVFPRLRAWATYPDGPLHTRVHQRADAAGFPLFDMLDAFQAVSGPDPTHLACDYDHPNAEGHGIAAAAVRDHLTAHAAEGFPLSPLALDRSTLSGSQHAPPVPSSSG